MKQNEGKKELTPEEKWEQATLANNFIFYKVMRHHQDACKQLLEMLLVKNAGKASIDAKANLIVESRAMKNFKLPAELPVLLMCSYDTDTQMDPSLFDIYSRILTNEKIQQAVLTESLTNYIYYKPDLISEPIFDFLPIF